MGGGRPVARLMHDTVVLGIGGIDFGGGVKIGQRKVSAGNLQILKEHINQKCGHIPLDTCLPHKPSPPPLPPRMPTGIASSVTKPWAAKPREIDDRCGNLYRGSDLPGRRMSLRLARAICAPRPRGLAGGSRHRRPSGQ